jgi:adrenodoxin-NADP+ reductase
MLFSHSRRQQHILGAHLHSRLQPIHRVCIVGSGPSGFYAAKYLLDKRISKNEFKVDLIDKLPTPFGLVRYGVAPDHPEVKTVEDQFTEVSVSVCVCLRNIAITRYNIIKQVATSPDFRYFGNVEVGRDISLRDLRSMYSAVILAYGAEGSRDLNIDGEGLAGVVQARSFVNWYNGHPDFAHLGPSLQLDRVRSVAIIGQGNVAMDCARILATPATALAPTDITSDAIAHLQTSAVQHIYVVGRRGYIQAACTIKELRELTQIEGGAVGVSIPASEIEAGSNSESLQEVEERRPLKRISQLMRDISSGAAMKGNTSAGDQQKQKQIELRFLLSPVKFAPSSIDESRVGAAVFEKCVLQGPPHQQKAIGTGQTETIASDLVLTSVGYKSLPLKDAPEVPFDFKSHTIPHTSGRVRAADGEQGVLRGLYVAGWLKRGPSGIIGSNIGDAKETVQSVCEDAAAGLLREVEVEEDSTMAKEMDVAARLKKEGRKDKSEGE